MRTRIIFRYFFIISLWLLVALLCFGVVQRIAATKAAQPSVHNSIFLDTTTPSFTIFTAGTGGHFSYIVTNFSGVTVAKGQVTVMGAQTALALPRLPDDYYVLQITDRTTGSPTKQTISFAVVSPFNTPANSPLGIGVHFMGGQTSGLIPLVAALGAGTVRDDAIWASIERSPGTYNFSSFDPNMQALQQNNIAPLLILDYNNRFYDNGQTPYDDTGMRAFARYAAALVTHYGAQVQAVEVYNEYNGTFSTGPCTRSPSCYAQLLRYTYQAIKAVRPDVTVVGGAVAYADLHWFHELFESGGLAYMDAVSDHPYTTLYVTSPELQGLENEMSNLQSLIKSYNHGRPKPIWITELGWSTMWYTVSERSQADYVVRGAILSLAAGVQKIFWYDLANDGPSTTKFEQNFGLLRYPDAAGRYMPKPAFVAYAVLARKLANRTFVRQESVMPGVYNMLFSGNLRVLWTTPFPQSVDLATNSPITITSMTGRTQTISPVGGRITLKLTADPVYVEGTVTSVSWHNPL